MVNDKVYPITIATYMRDDHLYIQINFRDLHAEYNGELHKMFTCQTPDEMEVTLEELFKDVELNIYSAPGDDRLPPPKRKRRVGSRLKTDTIQ